MKKFLIIICALFLVGCSTDEASLSLPEVNTVSSVSVNSIDVNYISEDSDWINILLTKFGEASTSKIEEVISKPSVDETITVLLTSGEEVTTLYVYEVDGVIYLEQSLRGSFEISEDTLTYILNGGE